jgi:fructose-1,6-bisphosphatase II / sedoheptulose-1,7-bisphosphatase
MGIDDPDKIYQMDEMARGDVLFAATGVTDGNLLAGVKFARDFVQTHTIVMRSSSRTVREIKAKHQDLDKF